MSEDNTLNSHLLRRFLSTSTHPSLFRKLIHDVNNSLTVMSGSLQLIKRMIKKEEIPIEKIDKLASEGLGSIKKIQSINDDFYDQLMGFNLGKYKKLKDFLEQCLPNFDKKLNRFKCKVKPISSLSDIEISQDIEILINTLLGWISENGVSDDDNFLEFKVLDQEITLYIKMSGIGAKWNEVISGPDICEMSPLSSAVFMIHNLVIDKVLIVSNVLDDSIEFKIKALGKYE